MIKMSKKVAFRFDEKSREWRRLASEELRRKLRARSLYGKFGRSLISEAEGVSTFIPLAAHFYARDHERMRRDLRDVVASCDELLHARRGLKKALGEVASASIAIDPALGPGDCPLIEILPLERSCRKKLEVAEAFSAILGRACARLVAASSTFFDHLDEARPHLGRPLLLKMLRHHVKAAEDACEDFRPFVGWWQGRDQPEKVEDVLFSNLRGGCRGPGQRS